MPTTHTFWNLSGFAEPTITNDTLHLPTAKQTIGVDDLLVPSGDLVDVSSTRYLDFTSPKRISDQADKGSLATRAEELTMPMCCQRRKAKTLHFSCNGPARSLVSGSPSKQIKKVYRYIPVLITTEPILSNSLRLEDRPTRFKNSAVLPLNRRIGSTESITQNGTAPVGKSLGRRMDLASTRQSIYSIRCSDGHAGQLTPVRETKG